MDLKTILGTAYTSEIEKAINEAVGKEFVSRADFNDKNESLKTANAQIEERNKQLDVLSKSAKGNEELLAQIEQLKTANTKTAEDLKVVQQGRLLDGKLMEAKPKNLVALRALLDHKKLEFDGDNVKGLDDQIEALKVSANYLFEDNIPSGTGGAPATGRNNEPKDLMGDLLKKSGY